LLLFFRPRAMAARSLLGNCFWREGFEAAFGPDRMGEKGGCRP
jgi:hypothetical protein